MIDQRHFDLWIKNNLNVLFEGRHGVGKTAMILEAFKRHFSNFLYFQGGTMDVYCDFIGVPKQVRNAQGEDVIRLITPEHIDTENVEAIFIDESNRAHKKTQNAMLELIQFGTINGRPFPKLRVVWTACNPEGDDEMDYNVFRTDPAFKDRFQVHMVIPYRCSLSYFNEKFGPEMAGVAVSWWNNLSDKAKNLVSPRRLDYTLDMYIAGGEIGHILPQDVVYRDLLSDLGGVSFIKSLNEADRNGELNEFLSTSDNCVRASKVFKQLTTPVQDNIVENMSDEAVMSNANNPDFTDSTSFLDRFNKINVRTEESVRENMTDDSRASTIEEIFKRNGLDIYGGE